MPKIQESSQGKFPILGYQAATAGTTQTAAGATVVTAPIVKVAVGNANDGVALPDASNPANNGQTVILQNSDASVAMKVWGASAAGATIDAGSADAAVTQAAATTFAYVQTAANTWKSAKLS